MKKIFVYSFFGLGDCIRFSPLFKGIQEELGEPCHFEFTSSTLPLQNLFDARHVQIMPMNLHKKYDAVLNFVAAIEVPQCDMEDDTYFQATFLPAETIWRLYPISRTSISPTSSES